MRLPLVLLSLCTSLPLLSACPAGDDTGDEGAAASTTDDDPTVADDTSTSTPPLDTDTSSSTTPPDTDSTTAPPDTDTNTETDTDSGAQPPGCECILDEEPADPNASPAAPTCGEALCPEVSGECVAGYCDLGAPFELDDPAALECALTALRDRTHGIVTWSFTDGEGILNDYGYVLVNEDGPAVRRNWVREDLSFVVGEAVLVELPPPEDYDACLAEADDLARFECLRAELAPSLGVCDEGWSCRECI